MGRKTSVICVIFAAAMLCLTSCGVCYKATKLRRKAAKASGAERHKLEGQAASLEAACLKKRDAKYDGKMQKEFEKMEKDAKN